MSEQNITNTENFSIDEVELPIKRVTGDTLEETLNENTYNNILPARYLKKDTNGDVVESPEDLFDRVASNVALADAVFNTNEAGFTIEATPLDIKPEASTNRRRDLCDEIFGPEIGLADESATVEVTDSNIIAFAYSTIVPKLPEELREKVERTRDEFHEEMITLGFMPNSPTLMNAGDDFQQLSACFVDSPEDDIDDIHQTEKEAAKIFQSGGGMGYAFSRLRPYGDRVGSTGGIASGPISFMRTFDQMCETIAQGGKRRGAQMAILNVEHPDIVQFIHAKNKDVSLAQSLRLNDPDDFTHNSFGEALEEARELVEKDENGIERVAKHLRNAAEGHLSNFNISVGITDAFMEAVQNDEDYALINPRTDEPYIANPETKDLYSWFGLGDYVTVGEPLEIPAREIWERIVSGAHGNGEPGMIFLDRVNDMHSFDTDEHPEHEILATNPCGEQPLEEYEACNLGHINLSTSVAEDAPDWRIFKEENDGSLEEQVEAYLEEAVDWDVLNRRVERGTHFLENVVTMSDFPVDKITEKVDANRKIGLGIMGLAQMYIQMGTKYGSDEANEIIRQLMQHINFESKKVSREIATGNNKFAERGSFDNWHKSKYANPTDYEEWFEYHTGEDAEDWADGYPVRNHNTTTIAPTGTTSMIGDTSGGCEPIFQVAYYKNVTQDVQGDEMLVEFDDYFLRVLEANDIDVKAVKKEAQKQMENNVFEGVDSLYSVPDAIGELFVVTSDLASEKHAKVQCAAQEGIDSAISKTVNAPNDATVEDAQEAFMLAYELGGKGVTYYRDGTRSKQVLTTRKDNMEDADEETLVETVQQKLDDGDITPSELGIQTSEIGSSSQPKKRPKNLNGPTTEINTGYGDLLVTINETGQGEPFEVIANIGKSGGYTESFTESTARLISLCLRCGVDPEEIVGQIDGIRSPKISWDEGDQVFSVPDGISLAMRRYLDSSSDYSTSEVSEVVEEDENVEIDDSTEPITKGQEDVIKNGENPECPECSSLSLYFSEGCKTCESCGWSEC
jgi:ribonucleoside-diphosphate reductase alpha chain